MSNQERLRQLLEAGWPSVPAAARHGEMAYDPTYPIPTWTAEEARALLDIADAARDALAVLVEYHEDLNATFLLADKLAVLNTNEEDA